MNKKMIIGTSVLILTLIGVGTQLLPKKEVPMVEEKISTLTVQDLSKTVKMDGVVKLDEEQSTFSTVSGLVNQRFVAVGDVVKKGQVLFTLETSTLNEKLAQAKYQLTVDQDAYEDAKAGANGALAASFERSQFAYERAQKELATQRDLFASGAVSAQELEQYVSKLESAKMDWVSAGEKLKNASLDNELKKISEKIKVDLMNIKNIEKDILGSTIRAEAAGTVIELLDDKQAFVNTGTLVAVTGDLEQLVVEAKVSEYDIAGIHIGQKALLTTLGNEEKVYEGVVEAIEPIGTTEKDEVLVKTTVAIHQPDALIKPNFTVSVAVTLDSRQAVLVVPYELLQKDEAGQWFVTKKTASGNESVVVGKGLETELLIEVLSEKLKAGDHLVYPADSSALKDHKNNTGGMPPAPGMKQ